jgi:uncharacterized protein (TIGR02246 family)
VTAQPEPSETADEQATRAMCQGLWDAWNRRNADDFAALFDDQGYVVGFDGSPMNGRAEIQATLRQIFGDHVTAAYVGKIRGVRFLTPGVAVVQAVAGMVPPGKSDLNPAVNAIQTFVAAKHHGGWRIASYQNTPAQFHGRPEMAQQLTEELRQLL